MDEHVAPDGEIEGRLIDEVFCGTFTKFNIRVACGCPLARHGESFGAAVDADERAVRADQLGSQHCYVAGTTAEVEHAHTWCEAGLTQEARRDRPQDGGLKHQAAKLGSGMAEDVGDIGHCSSAFVKV